MAFLIPADCNVPEIFAKRLGDSIGRQRAMLADGHLLLVLHEPPTPSQTQRTGRLFWRDPEGQWCGKPFGDGLQAIKRHVTEFTERADALEAEWFKAQTAADFFALLRSIAPLHRTTRNLHAVLGEARDLVSHDRDLINLRDRVGEIERTLELLHGDVRNGLDFTIAHQAEQQAERSYDMAVAAYRLNLLAAVFLPVATLSAIFGMNLTHGIDVQSTPLLFWGILGIGLVGGVFLARSIARKPTPITKATIKHRPAKR